MVIIEQIKTSMKRWTECIYLIHKIMNSPYKVLKTMQRIEVEAW